LWFSRVQDAWNRIGIDTLHLTYSTKGDLGSGGLVLGLADLLDEIGLSGTFTGRDRGRHGFENGLSFGNLVEVDWTDPGGEGPNRGFASVQLKGAFFEPLSSAQTAVVGLSMAEMGVHKCSRIDPQITSTECPSAGEVIQLFRAGKLAVARKRTFEPKGQELAGGEYPKGATICHGSRQSDIYVRQYDKHLAPGGEGPPRLRTEVEIKGAVAKEAWKAYVGAWKGEAVSVPDGLTEEVRLSQQLIRVYMPLRDVSQWEPGAKPKDWAGKAPEPEWWADLFRAQGERLAIQKRPTRALEAAVARSRKQSAGRYLQDLILTELKLWKDSRSTPEAVEMAAMEVTRGRMAMHAPESRLAELLANTPKEDHAYIRARWMAYGKNGGDIAEDFLEKFENGVNPPM
jgi:hypothetical protein